MIDIFVDPTDWGGGFIVVANVAHQLAREILYRSEDTSGNNITLNLGEPNFESRPHLRWPAQNPPSSRHQLGAYLIPVLADPKKLIQALDTLRNLKSFPSPKAVNTTTGPELPKDVSDAFGSLDLPWKPGPLALSLRRHLLPQVQTQEPDRRYLPRPNPRP